MAAIVNAEGKEYSALNEELRTLTGDVTVEGCMGQRFLCAGMSDKHLTVHGVPGNALGAYLNGADITVMGNAQDAVGDTMNEGTVTVYGNIGDAAGYAMRGGAIYVKGNAGYRAGIHMKAYGTKIPTIVIGGCAGSFVGEYQAGGVIVILGLDRGDHRIVGDFPCTGMHGGKMILRADITKEQISFSTPVITRCASEDDMEGLKPYLKGYAERFGYDLDSLMADTYTVIEPDSANPYKQMYVAN